jgi:hypothetical protein
MGHTTLYDGVRFLSEAFFFTVTSRTAAFPIHPGIRRGFSLEVKGKAIPLQPWTGPGGSRSLRLPDLETIST